MFKWNWKVFLHLVEVLMCSKVDSILTEDIFMNVELEYIFRVERDNTISGFLTQAMTNRCWAS